MTPQWTRKPTDAPIRTKPGQNGLRNDKYTVAMACTPRLTRPPPVLHQREEQRLLNAEQSPDGWGYAVFSQVTAGTEIVDAIRGVQTGRHGFHSDVPVAPVVIEKAVEIV